MKLVRRTDYLTFYRVARHSLLNGFFIPQNLYREVHRKGHACYQPVYFSVVLEQMNTAQPAVKISMTGEHIHKPLLDFLKDYLPKIVNAQFGEVFE